MARPTRGDESRSEIITVRVTRAERVRLEQRAAAAGLSASALAAQLLAKGQVTVQTKPRTAALAPELTAEFKRIGVNINQIARALNARKAVRDGEVARHFADFLRTVMKDEFLKVRSAKAAARLPKTPGRGPL